MTKPFFGIIAKKQHPEAEQFALAVGAWLTERSISYCVDELLAQTFNGHGITIVKREEMTTLCSHIVAIGGDGTLISAARFPSKTPPKIIGVNVGGTLSFLSDINAETFFTVAEEALKDQAKIEKSFLLETKIIKGGTEVKRYYAFNDVVLGKETLSRILNIKVSFDNGFSTAVKADGVIVSTPIGSTGYALSAGASVVHPLVQAIVVTPICPHSLTSRPLVIPANTCVSIATIKDATRDDPNVFLTIDGQEGVELDPDTSVEVLTSDYEVCLVRQRVSDYYKKLSSKLQWASR